jgi:hypothetical protein
LTGKNRSDRCFSGHNLGTTLAEKQKIGAKLCCILLSFFLRISVVSQKKNCVPLWTLESFGEVAFQNKINFRSGLWRALEASLLGTTLHSALDFVELWRGCFSEQNHVLLWTLEERVLAGNFPPLVVFASNP